jgi:DNA repair protein RadD
MARTAVARLRGYQTDGIADIMLNYALGFRRIVYVLPTAAGKTVMFVRLARVWPEEVIIMAHRRELIRQASQKLGATPHGVIAPGFPRTRHRIQVASVQTLARRSISRVGLIIPDECFPAGTLVGGVPIENLQSGDIVPSFEVATKRVTGARVMRLISKKTEAVTRITLANDYSVVSTLCHPILTTVGWRRAESITKNCNLYVRGLHGMWQDDPGSRLQCVGDIPENRTNLLSRSVSRRVGQSKQFTPDGRDEPETRICPDDRPQSDAPGRCARENEGHDASQWFSPESERRKRNRVNRSPGDATGGTRRSVGGGTRGPDENAAGLGVPALLQGGSREPAKKSDRRNRRRIACEPESSSPGREENESLAISRVVSVEIFKRGSDAEFERLCPNGDVYNLEVSGEHVFLANGIAVHNCHHSCATTWRNFFDSQPDSLIAGFTATPERLDGRGLGDVYDKMIVGPEIPEFVLAGYLKPTRIFAPPINVDLSAVHTLGGDYSAGELAEIMDKPGLTGSAVEHYGRLTPGQPAVVFCATVAAAEHEAEGFRAAGWRSEAVHGGLFSDERDRRIGGLETGDVQVLAACDLISEGLDIPSISVVILRRPTKSLARYKQDLGRGMRPGPGAPWLTVLDHAGNLRQHGMPDAYHEWTLDGRPRKKNAASEAPAVRICPECYRAHEPAPACPECGHLYEVARRKVIGPRQHDGELIEVKSVAPVTKAMLREAKTWADVEAIRIRHGYKEGWTDQVMRFRSRRRITTTSAAEEFGITVQRPDLEALAAE